MFWKDLSEWKGKNVNKNKREKKGCHKFFIWCVWLRGSIYKNSLTLLSIRRGLSHKIAAEYIEFKTGSDLMFALSYLFIR